MSDSLADLDGRQFDFDPTLLLVSIHVVAVIFIGLSKGKISLAQW